MNASRPSLSRAGGAAAVNREIPDATVARLPRYLRALSAIAETGVATVSSDELAAKSDVSPAKLRKDLSYLGSYGTRGVGYDCALLADEIARTLGVVEEWHVVIVGLGKLGQALAGFSGLRVRGLQVVALLDNEPDVVGTEVSGLTVRPVTELSDVVREHDVSIAVLTTPGGSAQGVCDDLVAAGVRSILNFAPVALQVPSGVVVRRVDLAGELQILAFHEQRRIVDGLEDDTEHDLPEAVEVTG